MAAAWLAAASLFFYAWWTPLYLVLLLASILFNYLTGLAISRAHERGRYSRSALILTFGITTNLLLLGYYKYFDFFLSTLNGVAGTDFPLQHIILPLGISFFTFTQIAFLVDAHRGIAKEHNFLHYVLFVTYFPHLIAGPVLHHKEMMPQFANPSTYRADPRKLMLGLTLFGFGLFKKVMLADNIASYATPVFHAADHGLALSFFEAWGGALSYTLQLYFDFSGYSDMAVGLSRMFGVELPLNFNSPYKANNIIEFWKRWHMTLSRFLRDYLYIPLGGNRNGQARRYLNLIITMLLGGLWHGAGWTYVAWGGLHGLSLAINHAWQALRRSMGQDSGRDSVIGRLAGRILTFLTVVVGWVFFRSETFSGAWEILRAMAGSNGVVIPGAAFLPQELLDLGTGLGLRFGSSGSYLAIPEEPLWIVGLMIIVFAMPNTQELIPASAMELSDTSRKTSCRSPFNIAWKPTRTWAVACGLMLALCIANLARVSEFLYFQF